VGETLVKIEVGEAHVFPDAGSLAVWLWTISSGRSQSTATAASASNAASPATAAGSSSTVTSASHSAIWNSIVRASATCREASRTSIETKLPCAS
jgi:hypothetical protein